MADNSNNIDNDESLMMLVNNGNHQAFTHLVNRHSKRFYNIAYRLCGDQFEAEDIVQEAFLKLWRKPGLWKNHKGAKFTTWFYKIVTNQCFDHMRKKKPQTNHHDFEYIADQSASQEDNIQRKQQHETLERAIAALPKRQKLALNLCVYEDVSNKDAAQILGVGVKALESLLSRAKAKLKDNIIKTQTRRTT